LGGNQLSTLPEAIAQLTHLQSLSLHFNQLSTLPEAIAQLTHLQSLDLRSNQLSTLPEWIGRLPHLAKLDLRGNPVPIPPELLGPQEIWKDPGDLAAILDYYFQTLDPTATAPLYEAKFIIVGEGGAGKTTLAQKLLDPTYALDKDEDSTEGIDVLRWEFDHPNGAPFRANIWDFGGQEIYHTTHQFFLTKRSLYVLVVDTRPENTDLDHWLNIVSLLSDNSPVFLIKNEKQDRQCQVNDRALGREFPNLEQVFATNLADNRGLGAIAAAIQQRIVRLPHVGTPLPKVWVRVRAALENTAQSCNTITLEKYCELCRTSQLTDPGRIATLSRYLHDLGVILHFHDDPILKRTVILKPEWGTDAVYKALDTKAVLDNYGRFTRTQLDTIWDNSDTANLRDELLQLMMRFKLCYEIPGRPKHYIAPQLLELNAPDYPWDDSANLILRYRYEFMPKGILTRLIVELHEYIEAQQLVWKTGVVFTNRSARAEVIENYPKSELHIRVSGHDQKRWLSAITHEIEKIHHSFNSSDNPAENRLRYKTLIPCNCPTCKGSQTPHNYAYDRLQKFLGDRQYQIQCQESYKMVEVRSLLDDILYVTDPLLHPERGIRAGDKPQGLPLQDTSSILNAAQKQLYQPPPAMAINLTTQARLKLIQSLNAMPQGQFEEMVSALNPPKGILPSLMGSQGSRASELLNWAEGPTGKGLEEVLQVLGTYLSLTELGIDLPQSNTSSGQTSPVAAASATAPATPKAVFISYAWGGDSEAMANHIDQTFATTDITLIRDKRDLGFKGRIKAFMEQIGQGNAVVVVISDKYLKSENCMFELVEIAANGDFYDRIFPIVLPDAQIYKPVQRIRYIKHWEQG
ncbi:MAG: TIR domain-containing protein, partial [Cyanobacteria bacterium]|nr:TIR domain-containing protein [Cyanobacteriota bacterium]